MWGLETHVGALVVEQVMVVRYEPPLPPVRTHATAAVLVHPATTAGVGEGGCRGADLRYLRECMYVHVHVLCVCACVRVCVCVCVCVRVGAIMIVRSAR